MRGVQDCNRFVRFASRVIAEALIHFHEGRGEQTSHSSWWPKHSAWSLSGLNLGYWAPHCETWFQKRLSEIRAGTATLRTGKQWRDALGMLKDTSRIRAANEKLAADYLARHK